MNTNIDTDIETIEYTISQILPKMIVKLKNQYKTDNLKIPADSTGKVTGIKFGDGKTVYYCVFGENEVVLERKEFVYVNSKEI